MTERTADPRKRRKIRRKSAAAGNRPPRRKRSLGTRLALFLLKAGLTVIMLAVLAAGGLFMAIEAGALDKTLTARAEGALNGAVGPRYVARVGKTAIRFAHNRQLAIEARDVTMVEQATGKMVSETGAIRMALDPFRLLSGELNVTRIEADNVRFDTALFATGTKLDLTRMRVDQLPGVVDAGFAQLDLFGGFVDRARTDALEVTGMELLAAQPDGRIEPIGRAHFTLERHADGALAMDGAMEVQGDAVPFSVTAERKLGKVTSLSASVTEIPLLHLGPAPEPDGTYKEKLEAMAGVDLVATRAQADVQPAITFSVLANPGVLTAHSIAQPFDGATIKGLYDFDKNSIEFLPSAMRFGDTNLPFTGGLIDLDRINPDLPKGFGIDLLVRGGKVYTEGGGAPPTEIEAQASGQYLSETKELLLDQLAASTPVGSLVGSMKMKFGGPDPEISFAAQTNDAQMQAVKQLWPFWIAPKARQWVVKNLYGGAVANGNIEVFLPAVRDRDEEGQIQLGKGQLKIDFDVTNARLDIAGDIPPVRGTTGHIHVDGPTLTVDIKSGTSYFPTDRSVSIDGGTFVIPNMYDRPLKADMAISVSGAADAVAELITYRPIKFLSRTGLEPADVAGNIRADVKASFGLNAADDVKPVWEARMALNNVDLMKPYQGRRLTGLTGTLDIDPDKALLAVKGKVDDVPMDLTATEPVGEHSTVERKREIAMALKKDDIARLFPNLEEVVGGTVKARIALQADERQHIEADLGQATLKVPGTGWTKGSGIPAKATFDITREDETVTVENFLLDGEGFGARGEIQSRGGKLVQASFDNVQLAANDRFSLKVKPIRSGYDVAVSGKSADIRAAITQLRNAGTGDGSSGRKFTLVVRAKLDKVYGFGDETLKAVDLAYAPLSADGGKLQLSAVTSSGQAVVGQMVDDGRGRFVQITSGDAGATFRFLGLYSRLQKGLMNTRIRPGKDGSWNGNMDIRDFQLANEERLQTIVETPTGKDGRSLNKAVRRDIDVRSERFQRGFAYFTFSNGALRIENGILRGTQVGATFQGTVRDEAGNMDVTGTFMPAYGLNRLFAELPVIGILLGNGRDRGLLGITFKLTGPFEKPNLTINPLSIIAPGIFRSIFEFQ